jgi:hypothetical protein
MRLIFPTLLVLTELAACDGSDDSDTSIKVFKSMGTQQCSAGVPLSVLQGQLAAANVQVSASACGTDGMANPTVCGTPDGKIGIFDISSNQASAAAAAGFTPLSSLPGAKTVPCT